MAGCACLHRRQRSSSGGWSKSSYQRSAWGTWIDRTIRDLCRGGLIYIFDFMVLTSFLFVHNDGGWPKNDHGNGDVLGNGLGNNDMPRTGLNNVDVRGSKLGNSGRLRRNLYLYTLLKLNPIRCFISSYRVSISSLSPTKYPTNLQSFHASYPCHPLLIQKIYISSLLHAILLVFNVLT
jgi:hypothetical protein